MHAWYVTFQDGFEFAMGPNDPPADHVVLVFLTKDAANAWVVDNHAELWARIIPCTIMDGHFSQNFSNFIRERAPGCFGPLAADKSPK